MPTGSMGLKGKPSSLRAKGCGPATVVRELLPQNATRFSGKAGRSNELEPGDLPDGTEAKPSGKGVVQYCINPRSRFGVYCLYRQLNFLTGGFLMKRILIITVILIFTFGAGTSAEAVFDDLGRELVLEETPERLISLAPAVTEILFALELDEKIVGVSNFCDYPEAALEKPKVGDVNVDFEAIVEKDPHLVFMTAGMDEDREKIEELGYKVAVVDPGNIEEIFNSIKWIGRITGQEQKSNELVAWMEEEIEAVKEKAQELQTTPRVYYEVWDDPLMTAGPNTFVHDIIKIAGGENIAGDLDQEWAPYSVEDVIANDPEVIIVPWKDNRVYERTAWSDISAVQNERVYFVDPDLMVRPGPRIIEGLELVLEAILGEGK